MIGSVAYWRKVLALVHGQSGIKTAGTEDNGNELFRLTGQGKMACAESRGDSHRYDGRIHRDQKDSSFI